MPFRLRRSASIALAIGLALAPAAAAVAVADAPAVDDTYVVNEDETLIADAPGVLANDDAGDGQVCVVGIDVEGLSGQILDAGNTGWRTDGWFTFTPWSEWIGETSWVYGMKALENGECIGPALGQGRVTITVRPVNDPPTAVVAGSCDSGVTVAQDSGAYDDPSHCVENHNWGPIDENTQALSEWVVTNNHPGLFAAQPRIDIVETTYGALHFRPAAGANGVAKVTVRARDDGGTARGGNDLSEPISFTLTITATPDPTAEPTLVPPTETAAPTEDSTVGNGVPATPAESTGAVTGTPTSAQGGGPGLPELLILVVVVVGFVVLAPRVVRWFRPRW